MRLRQQDPATSLWSMCQITTFASAAGARVSIIVDWYYTGATFTVPTVCTQRGAPAVAGAPLSSTWAAVRPPPLYGPTSATASGRFHSSSSPQGPST